MSLTRIEKETIVLFNEEEPTADCFTYNVKLLNRLARIAESRPDECRLVKDNGDGGFTYEVPKSWVKINPTRLYTVEQRAALAERMKSNLS